MMNFHYFLKQFNYPQNYFVSYPLLVPLSLRKRSERLITSNISANKKCIIIDVFYLCISDLKGYVHFHN